jgi:hypothetical protein
LPQVVDFVVNTAIYPPLLSQRFCRDWVEKYPEMLRRETKRAHSTDHVKYISEYCQQLCAMRPPFKRDTEEVKLRLSPSQMEITTDYPFAHDDKANALLSAVGAERAGMPYLPFMIYGEGAVARGNTGSLSTHREIVGLHYACFHTRGNRYALKEIANCRGDEKCADFKRYPKIFNIAHQWGDQTYHTLIEGISRVAYHADFLRANPDIVILVAKVTNIVTNYFKLWNIKNPVEQVGSKKIVSQIGDQALLPMAGSCGHPEYNFWELQAMRYETVTNMLLASPHLTENSREDFDIDKDGSVVLVVRTAARSWKKGDTNDRLVKALTGGFPGRRFELFDDSNSTLMGCVECQVAMWRRAKVVVAPHGAGLSNSMYCLPGAIVVEIGSMGSLGPLIFQQISVMAGVQHYYHIRPFQGDPIPEQLVEETQRILRFNMDPTGMTEQEKIL